MKKYRKKPIIIEAEQWFKKGDVPEAQILILSDYNKWTCSKCGYKGYEHGNCKTLDGYHIVCPGDYIIKGIRGEFCPCKPDIFKEIYEEIKDE